jgi:hypothetical protein
MVGSRAVTAAADWRGVMQRPRRRVYRRLNADDPAALPRRSAVAVSSITATLSDAVGRSIG